MQNFSFHTSAMRGCCDGTLFWSKLTSTSVSLSINMISRQDDLDNAFYKLHRERNQTLLQFANVARAAYLKHDSNVHPLPDRTKA